MNVPLPSLSSTRALPELEALTFESLVEAEHAGLFKALYLVSGNRAEAEELMQDAFLAVWERWDRVRVMDDPTGYLFKTAMNLFRKRRRRASVAIRKVFSPALHEDAFDSVLDRAVVFQALEQLTPAERAAIVVTALLGYSSEEAARMLGTTAGTIRVRTSRARAQMQRTAGETG